MRGYKGERELMKVHFLLDPLESLHGPLTPPFLIADKLKGQFDAVLTSQMVNIEIAEFLKSRGFIVLNSHKRFYSSGSVLTLEAWLRRSKLKLEQGKDIILNFSQCYLTNSHIYYAQGPITKALDDMYPEMNRTYKLAYLVARRFFIRRDKAFVRMLRSKTRLFIANSRFCARMYEQWGIKVDNIIYPPIDCEQFQPTTSNPSRDYVLTYIGKEAKYSVLKAIADAGVKIKAFGSKETSIPNYLHRHPSIEFLGRVSDAELVSLYSNALYTLFTFTHEPFGYVPVESMACGTPVLTYNRQGPSESLINGQTGWLAEGDEELADAAAKLWKEDYPENIRKNCRRRALEFDAKIIARKWSKLIKELHEEDTKTLKTKPTSLTINVPSTF
jgi:glycosyltransferase involved in cell wall biosynthesis